MIILSLSRVDNNPNRCIMICLPSDNRSQINLLHRVPRHIWGHGFVKVGDTDLKRRFQVSWCLIINYIIITII
jgi:hypothetical protein